tara:strand:+ start:20546 stop:21250 length:705 start_codon:yes stop_codon:yes gene_type:complete
MNTLRIILIGGILGLIILLAFFLLSGQQEVPGGDPSQGDGGGGSNGQQTITPLPDGSDNLQTPVDVIQGDFQELQEIEVTRELKKPGVNLITDLVKNSSSEFEAVTSVFYIDDYLEMTCSREGEQEKAVMFTAQSSGVLGKDEFLPAMEALDDWAPLVVRDLGWMLYPKTPGVESVEIEKIGRVPATGYKRGVFELNGEEYSLYYGWTLNYVFFSPTLDCLEAAQIEIYAPQAH